MSQGLTLYNTILTFLNLEEKPLENTEGKGENVGNQHFHLFQQCFLVFLEEISTFLTLWYVNALNLEKF